MSIPMHNHHLKLDVELGSGNALEMDIQRAKPESKPNFDLLVCVSLICVHFRLRTMRIFRKEYGQNLIYFSKTPTRKHPEDTWT